MITKKTYPGRNARTDCPSGVKKLLADRKINRMANEMEAYLMANPDLPPQLWVREFGQDKDWSFVFDPISGVIMVGREQRLKVGDMYDLQNQLRIAKWNGNDITMRCKVMRQVTMKEVSEFARKPLPYRPFCYEVSVD